MSNLFFVHTPFQLFVAQQIIRQEHLVGNIMLYGYIGENRQFLEVYDLTVEPSFWSMRYLLTDLPGWASLDKHDLLGSACRIAKKSRYIRSIVRKHDVRTVYLGDLNNLSCKFTSLYLGETLGLDIVFYEEGTSHYTYTIHAPQRGGRLLNQLLAACSDLFFYFPLFRMKFGHWRFVEDMPFSRLKITRRFSIVTRYYEPFDRQLKVSPLFSSRLRGYLRHEVGEEVFRDCVLFLSQPIYELVRGEEGFEAYLSVVERQLAVDFPNGNFLIKFHPREQGEVCLRLLAVFDRLGRPYKVLSGKVNIPVEYYLMFRPVRQIITMYSSTKLYNGIVYPKAEYYSLLLPYKAECDRRQLSCAPELEQLVANVRHHKM